MTMAAEPDYGKSNSHNVKKDKQTLRDEERAKDPRIAALDRCDDMIDWYQANMKSHRINLLWARVATVITSGLVPVLVIAQVSYKDNAQVLIPLSILIALFPASAAIFSALNELFQYRENWIRFSETAELLKSEKIKFLTRTTKNYDQAIDEYKALSNFVTRIEYITIRETKRWGVTEEQSKDLDAIIDDLSGTKNE